MWQAAAWLQLVAVCVLSLGPPPPDLALATHGDKAGHVLAYLCLGAWFTALHPTRPRRWWIGLALLGVLLEVLQGTVTGAREPASGDVLANLAGLGLGGAFSLRLWPRWLRQLDAGVCRLGGRP